MNKKTFPLLALWVIPVLGPEFIFGNPSTARILLISLLVGATYYSLAKLANSPQWRNCVAWIDSRSSVIAYALIAAHAVVFTAIIVLRHVYFNSQHGDDTAYYNQIFWNTLSGKFFYGTVTQARYFDPPVNSEFALHNSPILLLLLPLYGIFPSFYTLLIVKNVFLSAGAIPIFLIARDKLGGAAGIVICLSYLFSTNLVTQLMNGFYPLHLVAFSLPYAFLFFSRQRFWPFALWLILSLSIREEIALTGALFGVYALLSKRDWRWITVPIAVSAAWWYMSTEIVMVRSRIAMEELEPFYAMFGGGHNKAMVAVLEDPAKFAGLFLNPALGSYLYDVFKATAGLSLASLSLIFVLPTLLVNSLIGVFMPAMMNQSYHYSTVIVPAVFFALIMGLVRFVDLTRVAGLERRVVGMGGAILLLPIMLIGTKDMVLSYGGGYSIAKTLIARSEQPSLSKIVALVPPDASVAAPNILMPQLSYRPKLYSSDRLWRYHRPDVEYIVLNANVDQLSAGDRNKPKFEALLSRMRGDGAYRLIFNEGGFEVYHRRSIFR
jgi:uncharacterized membrane protein